MTLNEIVRACRGSFGYPADIEITEISADTRTIRPGSVFIALKGERYDGNDFALEAMEKGAYAVICERPIPGAKCIIVDDIRLSMLLLAESYRRSFPVRLAAVTGSVGKTTVTNMLGNILSLEGKTLVTEENRHDETGMPLTLFKLDASFKNAVVEMGITPKSGVSALSVAAAPDIAVITNIGYSHFESYGSLENILKAKMEILDGADYSSPLVLNFDDKLLSGVTPRGERRVVFYSVKDRKADVFADSIKTENEKVSFNINYNGEKFHVTLNCMGKHNVSNALGAFAAAVTMGVSSENAVKGIEMYVPDGYRQQFVKTKSCRVLTDLSNFSPEAVKAAVDIIKNCEVGEGGRRIAVLADMPALGKKSSALHRSVGESLEKSGIDILYCIDSHAEGYIQGAVKKGHDENNARLFDSSKELAKALEETVRPEDVVLLKCRREYTPLEILAELDK